MRFETEDYYRECYAYPVGSVEQCRRCDECGGDVACPSDDPAPFMRHFLMGLPLKAPLPRLSDDA